MTLDFRGALALLPLLAVLGCEPPAEGEEKPADAGPTPDDDGICGNGVVEAAEQCDDANASQTDACKTDCTLNVCGDRHVLEGVEECDLGDTLDGDGCSATCLRELPPLPDTVRLGGTVVSGGFLDPGASPEDVATDAPVQHVVVQSINVFCSDGLLCPPATTDGAGAFTIADLPPQSTFSLTMSFPSQTANPALYAPDGPLYAERNQGARHATIVPVFVGSADLAEFRTEMVRSSWLEQLKLDCGATANPPSLWNEYSNFVGFLRDAQGNAVVGVPKTRLTVDINGYENNVPGDKCFLTKDENGIYRGSTSATSLAEGDGGFIIFKAKNGELGTGSGGAFVRVAYAADGPNFAPARVSMTAGAVGLVTLTTQDEVPPVIDQPVFFDTDVYPVFTEYACVVCHREGGPAAFLRMDESPEEVYDTLVSGGTTCTNTALPICANEVSRSLLLTYPLLEDPPDAHPNASFTDTSNAAYRAIEAWILQGVPLTADASEP